MILDCFKNTGKQSLKFILAFNSLIINSYILLLMYMDLLKLT